MMFQATDIDRLSRRAQQQIQYGDPQGAMDTLREALSIAPDDPILHSLLALVLVDLKRRHAALHEARLGLEAGPEEPFCHYALGLVYMLHQKYKQAMTHLKQAISLDPDTAAYQLATGSVCMKNGQRKMAKNFFEHALEMDPENPDGFTELGNWYRRQGKPETAETYLKKALELEPSHAGALVEMGHILLCRGNIEGARDHAVWVLQHDATDESALLLLSSVKARSNPFLGIWWRVNSWLTSAGNGRMIFILVMAYAVFRVGALLLKTHGNESLAESFSLFWLGIVIYSWVGPIWFRKSLRKELETVSLHPDY